MKIEHRKRTKFGFLSDGNMGGNFLVGEDNSQLGGNLIHTIQLLITKTQTQQLRSITSCLVVDRALPIWPHHEV